MPSRLKFPLFTITQLPNFTQSRQHARKIKNSRNYTEKNLKSRHYSSALLSFREHVLFLTYYIYNYYIYKLLFEKGLETKQYQQC